MIDSVGDLEAFVREFESCRLPKARWTHAAHLTIGLWYLSRQPFGEALAEVRTRIRRYNESVGTANTDDGGYHETLTKLFLLGIREHAAAHPGETLPAVLAALLASPLADSAWPLRYYSRQRLFSVAARRDWLAPDLAPPPGAGDSAAPPR